MGVSLAGFQSLAVVEWNKFACETIRENQRRGFPLVSQWPLYEGDVRAFDWSSIPENIDLLAGGPPCQPFSMGGKHKAFCDDRNMFPATIEVIRKLRPKAFLLENVKGLTRKSFSDYFSYILLQLQNPALYIKPNESWLDHLNRLRAHSDSKVASNALQYNVVSTLVNAADYGIPQQRYRVFIVGFRSDLNITWSFPRPTHSLESLLYSQWVSGEYWSRHRADPINTPTLPAALASKVKKLSSCLIAPTEKPWVTVRDCLNGLPDPTISDDGKFHNHRFQAGAKVYPGHTGSPTDLPSKTLKAGDHGVPGGENMMVNEDGAVRYFTTREAARIQTFPDGYIFPGSWTEAMRQIGNAVPVQLARIVATSIAQALASAK